MTTRGKHDDKPDSNATPTTAKAANQPTPAETRRGGRERSKKKKKSQMTTKTTFIYLLKAYL